ncbi:MAG: MBL fold metallo-hydrolase [Desulfurococcaceae archaeon]|nr:MBL fold metallo-hydrolase [Desulfurococcaceae archaeon]
MLRILNYVLGPLNTNAYVIYDVSTLEALVIDPATDEILPKISDLISSGLKVVGIIATHGHADHVCGVKGLRELVGCRFMLHELDVEVLKESVEWALEWGIDVSFNDVRPDILLKGGEVLRLGSDEVQIIHTPGHTPGSITIYIPSSKVLFTGDTLFKESVGRTDLPGGSWDKLVNSLRMLVTRFERDVVVYPGHGPSSTIGYEVDNNLYVKRVLRGRY